VEAVYFSCSFYSCLLRTATPSFFTIKKIKVMKRNHFLLISLIGLTTLFQACKEKSKGDEKATTDTTALTTTAAPPALESSRLDAPPTPADNCITLTRAQVLTWIGPGWSDPTEANHIPFIIFTPIPPANPGDPIRVTAAPADRDGNVQENKRVELKIKAGVNPPCAFIPNLDIRDNKYVDFYSQFDDGSGNLINFSFIRLRPIVHPTSLEVPCTDCLGFDIEMVVNKQGAEIVYGRGSAKPSPPAVDADKKKK
jgi:hypothetical protein